jgi:hypothetical protein
MLFDATNPYHRYMFHYESDDQLSLPEIIAKGSVDASTAAIIWHLIEHRASFMIAGPTDPTPGVGKTTTLNALLPFYPSETGLVYTLGMFEEFAFLEETDPAETTVLANEVSNHLRIYMWGRKARQLLRLPERGYAIATTCHADTINDVLAMLEGELAIPERDICNLRFIVNIGLHGRIWPPKRRWLTTHFVMPQSAKVSDRTSIKGEDGVSLRMVSQWNAVEDTFSMPDIDTLATMAAWSGETVDCFVEQVARRADYLSLLAAEGADQDRTMEAIMEYRSKNT